MRPHPTVVAAAAAAIALPLGHRSILGATAPDRRVSAGPRKAPSRRAAAIAIAAAARRGRCCETVGAAARRARHVRCRRGKHHCRGRGRGRGLAARAPAAGGAAAASTPGGGRVGTTARRTGARAAAAAAADGAVHAAGIRNHASIRPNADAGRNEVHPRVLVVERVLMILMLLVMLLLVLLLRAASGGRRRWRRRRRRRRSGRIVSARAEEARAVRPGVGAAACPCPRARLILVVGTTVAAAREQHGALDAPCRRRPGAQVCMRMHWDASAARATRMKSVDVKCRGPSMPHRPHKINRKIIR